MCHSSAVSLAFWILQFDPADAGKPPAQPVVQHPRAAKEFALSFSDEPFHGHDAELTWVEEDVSGVGNWYRGNVAGSEMTGWLCPALQLYFEGAPPRLFVEAPR